MKPVTVSPKYQVGIPKEVRDRLHLSPGQRLRVFAHDGRIELIPVRTMTSMRGAFRGLATRVPREPDRL